ncbi:TetR/AcrR family transcriptional regulator [Staphylococcus saprophyticus]|uniref:TetR/AcrR family transcriptional regulator n=1 Tax=Staphylococcus saprophyticus TaxID=29385 RepID=UPI000E02798E|nr:TetR/AcrR family transcriptional regulator [Staphylococcus saprophyticus]MCC4220558.1 TetR/AcrR family transcriptional regulator [Staphylococcus saprophyticus]MDW4323134.1 TetR/AcrR family transcriptional regulator [Staphylococcus saprophyticus]MDW4380661.1 TetR/AcrR family transcriptional regulator [Staphylococcus saprophyticus]MDW4400884.1 TetR/AcrR family transcriptional regulator [Staphylococcus saprophyticus]MDW4426658.1 TetR/AcrR family transcriptional regulator [Staphylococcus saprop
MSQKKQDILSVAERLFYEYGFKGVGLKQIIQEANVATMTLYNHFESKDNLVAQVLKQRETRYWHYLDSHVEQHPEKPFISAVTAHCQWLNDYSYKGDMFMRAIEDYADTDNEIESTARGHKERLLHYLEKLAGDAGIENGYDLAVQYTLLLEGTTSMTALLGSKDATSHAITMAKLLLNEAHNQ